MIIKRMKYIYMLEGNGGESNIFQKQYRNPPLADEASVTPNHPVDKVHLERERDRIVQYILRALTLVTVSTLTAG